MLTNSSILIIGGTGSFGNTFVPMTLAKYNPKRLVIYSRDEMKQWDMAHKFEGDGRVRFFTSITNEFDPNKVRRVGDSLYLGPVTWVSNPIASLASQGFGKEYRRNASCTTGIHHIRTRIARLHNRTRYIAIVTNLRPNA